MRSLPLLLATAAMLFASDGSAQNRPAKNSCPIVGVKAFAAYATKAERRCFSNVRRAERAGFEPFTGTLTASAPRPHAQARGKSCAVVGLTSLGKYLRANQRRCFKNEAKAQKAGFISLQAFLASLPTPTPTGTPAPGTPTPTPTATPIPTGTTPPGDPVNFAFPLGPTDPGSGLAGNCTAVMNGARTEFAMSCTHNVPAPLFTHLVLLDNTEVCSLASPDPSFNYACAVTPSQAAAILAGQAVVDIHTSPTNVAVAGLVTPPG